MEETIQRIIEVGCRVCGKTEGVLCNNCRKNDILDEVLKEIKEIKKIIFNQQARSKS